MRNVTTPVGSSVAASGGLAGGAIAWRHYRALPPGTSTGGWILRRLVASAASEAPREVLALRAVAISRGGKQSEARVAAAQRHADDHEARGGGQSEPMEQLCR